MQYSNINIVVLIGEAKEESLKVNFIRRNIQLSIRQDQIIWNSKNFGFSEKQNCQIFWYIFQKENISTINSHKKSWSILCLLCHKNSLKLSIFSIARIKVCKRINQIKQVFLFEASKLSNATRIFNWFITLKSRSPFQYKVCHYKNDYIIIMSQSDENDQFQQILNSLEISKRKMNISVHQSKLLEESKKQQSKRFTMELPTNQEASQSQKERIITNHLLKDLAPLDKQNDENLKTPKVPPTKKIKTIKKGILLLGQKFHKDLSFYLKTMEPLDFQELQQSNELLIQNALCAGKYVNDYGLFCVLKEALNKKNIKTIIQQDCIVDEDGNFAGIPQNTINLRKSLGLQELHYCSGKISLLKFHINNRFNLSNYIFWSKELERLESAIKDSLMSQDQQILIIRIDETYLEFTIPEFDDNQSPQFMSKLRQQNLDVQVLPLITHFTFRLSDLNPWMNKEINKEWKLFSVQCDQQQCIGYIDMNQPTIFNEIPSPKTLAIKLYGETHQYQLVLQMSEKQVMGILLRDKA
ncbi:unnamed protein product [Paramecium octaurelia]|uniref:Uncharacterized protein n=1 Tax=Paramecium octaurelia TaxID=43137 RepID=A0A8S1UQM3_PAROT|nr:unnamed protein product [Paramecium octaurelia]